MELFCAFVGVKDLMIMVKCGWNGFSRGKNRKHNLNRSEFGVMLSARILQVVGFCKPNDKHTIFFFLFF